MTANLLGQARRVYPAASANTPPSANEITVFDNFNATSDPGVNQDSTQGYKVGSMYYNTVGLRRWVCTDNPSGAARWVYDGADFAHGGTLPNNAEPITVRNGEVHVGKYAALDYESGDPVKVKEGASPEQIRDALMKSGSLAKGQKFFGLKRETPAHVDVAEKARDMEEAQNAVVKTKDGALGKAEPALREVNEKIDTMKAIKDCLK